MAVPKKKRYKQIVSSRRSLQRIELLKKHNVKLHRYSNFTTISSDSEINYDLINKNCGFCGNGKSKKVCLNRYTSHFIGAYVKYIKNKN